MRPPLFISETELDLLLLATSSADTAMQRAFVAEAAGSYGRQTCTHLHRRGWYVIAQVRSTDITAAIFAADQLVEAHPDDPTTLAGLLDGVDLLVFRASHSNLNLLHEAHRAGVRRIVCILSDAKQPAEIHNKTHLSAAPRARVHYLPNERKTT